MPIQFHVRWEPNHQGYSLCGIAGMNAVAGRAAAARQNITRSTDTILTPNGMYGEQERMNHPDEFGPTAESAYCIGGVLHTMLLHTVPSTGVVEIFAGVDRAWDAAFWQLRAGGGLLVSAKRQNGTVSFVGLWSRHAQEVVIRVSGEPAWSPAAVRTSHRATQHGVGCIPHIARGEGEPVELDDAKWSTSRRCHRSVECKLVDLLPRV